MFYGLRVNWALLRLGFRPRIFTSAHRELMQKAGDHLTTAASIYREIGMRFWLHQAQAEINISQ